MLKRYISPSNPTGIEPVPNSALMNDSQNLTVAVEPGKTYLFHLINVGAFASQYFWIEGHTMKIVQVDGIWTEMAETNMLYMASAQRYSVLVTMKSLMSQNYAMVGSMDKVFTITRLSMCSAHSCLESLRKALANIEQQCDRLVGI